MKNHPRRAIVYGLGILCVLAPLSSRLPDSVQQVTGLPGGASGFLKAISGTAAVVLWIYLLAVVLKRGIPRGP